MTEQTRRHQLRITVLLGFLALVGPMAGLSGWYAARQLDPGLLIQLAKAGSPLASVLYLTLLICLAGFVLAFLTYFFVIKKVVAPLDQFVDQFERLAVMGVGVPGQLARPNITQASPRQRLARFHEVLVQSIGRSQNQLAPIHQQALQIQQSNRHLGDRFGQQISALQQTATGMEQLAATVVQNADNARQANQLAVTASEVAQRGGVAVDEVVSTMQQIAASSQKIADIVGVIDSIAFQTNILALNAAVEAARAGEQGKGFAVVASEVRALAQRSAHAAREIKDLIDDSSKRVSEGSGQVERAGTTMQEILGSVARVTDIMGEISAATLEQTSGIEEVKQVVGEMGRMTHDTARLFDESATVAQKLSAHVKALAEALAPLGFAKTVEQGAAAKAVERVADTPDKASPALAASTRSAPALLAANSQTIAPQLASANRVAVGHGAPPVVREQATSSLAAQGQPLSPEHTAAPASATALAGAPGAGAQSGLGQLLRPDLQSGASPYQSAEDDWEEF